MVINPQEVYNSYKALLNGCSEDEREQLFELSRQAMPKLADYLVDQFRIAEGIDLETKNKVIGATFMFLAFVNAIDNKPPSKASNIGSWPSFGKLPPLY